MAKQPIDVGVKFTGDVRGFQKAVSQANKSLSSLKKMTQTIGLNAAFDIANKVMNSTRALVDFTKEAAKLAGEAEGITAAFNRLGKATLLGDLQKATRGTVDNIVLMQKAVQASNFKIPLDQLATFFEFATKRAIQTGESVDYLVNSIITGIGRKSVLVMDNLGISSVELQKEVKKVGDFGIASGNIIRRELESMGDVADTTTVRMQQTAVAVKNLKVAWGEYVNQSKAIKEVIGWLTDEAKIFADKDLNVWQKMFVSPNEYKKWRASFDAAREIIPLLKDMGSYKSPFVVPDKVVEDLEEVAKKAKEAMEALKEFNSHSSLGYRGIGYGGREGADIKAYKPQFGTWKAKTPGIQSYGGMSPEDIKAMLEENKIADNLEKVQNLVGGLGDSFAQLFYNVGGGWKNMIDSMISSFKMLVAQIAAKTVIFAILNVLSGGSGMIGKMAGSAIGGGLKGFLGFAGGTNFAPGGLSLVGERGPELVNLPRGSQVIPNHKLGGSQDMLITKISGSQLDIILKRHYRSLASNT